MLSHKLVLPESENFTSGLAILAPPTIPINHYFSSRNQQNRDRQLFDPMLVTNNKEQPEDRSWSWKQNMAATSGAEVLSYYSMLIYSRHEACLKHSNFFKVNDQELLPQPNKWQSSFPEGWPTGDYQATCTSSRP